MVRISTSQPRASRNVKNGPSPLQIKLSNLMREARWIFFAFGAVWLGSVLFTWSPSDPGWSHSLHSNEISNVGGVFGAHIADFLLFLFGRSSWLLVLLLLYRVLLGFYKITAIIASKELKETLPRVHWEAGIGFFVLFLGSMGIEAFHKKSWGLDLPAGSGGQIGIQFSNMMSVAIGSTGTTLLLLSMIVIGLSLSLRFSWLNIAEKVGLYLELAFKKIMNIRAAYIDRKMGMVKKAERAKTVVDKQIDLTHDQPIKIEPAVTQVQQSVKAKKEQQVSLFTNIGNEDGAQLPEINLLDQPCEKTETISSETIEYTSRLIEKKLSDFGVKVTVVSAQAGPVVTRYEIEPATGVKGSQIVNLAKDLARALSLVNIRVVETIPGKNLMGLELPNPKRQIVNLSEIIGSQTYHSSKSLLTVALGKDIAGNPVVADLSKMPHLLVAGTTGSGKSVGINAMLLSLLYKADPSEVRLILIDPKMLEMSVYEGIPHLLAPVVTDMSQAGNALNWCVAEMDKRYRLMSKLGVRNVAGFNIKIKEAEKNNTPIPNPFSLTPDNPENLTELPFIVVVIDELADLMMVAGKKVEELIARLAQKARAAGIHLVLATQRPSVDVITGLIKANIPTRIAFQVSSKIDSRTILDQMGAESLLGMGDMLYMPPGTAYPVRVHGAFVHDEEVHRVVEAVKQQGEANYIDGLLEGGMGETGDGLGSVTGFEDPESEPLYDQAVQFVLEKRKASISSVQRQFRIGYNRAARMIEQMESAGIVSAMQSNGSREILVPNNHSDI